jgi:DNA-binding Xre family transcriptional regulator
MARKTKQISSDPGGNTSLGAPVVPGGARANRKKPVSKKFELSQALTKIFSVIQMLSELRHAQYTVRFVSNTSVEAILHYGLQKICAALEVSHFVSDLIEAFFYFSIFVFTVNICLELVGDSVTAIKRRFFSKESAGPGLDNKP